MSDSYDLDEAGAEEFMAHYEGMKPGKKKERVPIEGYHRPVLRPRMERHVPPAVDTRIRKEVRRACTRTFCEVGFYHPDFINQR